MINVAMTIRPMSFVAEKYALGPEPGRGGRPQDFGKIMDLFDFVIMNLTFFRFRPPPRF